MTNTLPSRLSESAFRRFESVIANATYSWPGALFVDPTQSNLAATTYVARLRDAIRSFHDNKWPSKTIQILKFDQIYPDLVVSHKSDGRIVIGPKDSHAKTDVAMSAATDLMSLPGGTLDVIIANEQILQFVCFLAEKAALAKTLRLVGVDATSVTKMEQLHDVCFRDNHDKTFTLI